MIVRGLYGVYRVNTGTAATRSDDGCTDRICCGVVVVHIAWRGAGSAPAQLAGYSSLLGAQ